MSVYIYYHTHWDREWYLPFREYQVRLAEVIDKILTALEEETLPCFMLDGQTVILPDYLELRPENEERLRKMTVSGRLSLGPWYVMPDEFLVSGESLIRNLKKGIDIARSWGCEVFTGYLPDTFGHSEDMPMIFRNMGIQTAIIWRGIVPASSEFYWRSKDGSAVLTYHLASGYFQNMLNDPDLTPDERKQALQNWLEQVRAKSLTQKFLFPIGGDHLGPIAADKHELLKTVFPQAQETLPPVFMADLSWNASERFQNNEKFPEYDGRLHAFGGAFILPGVFSARLYLKQANRRLEHRLTRDVEPLIAFNQALNQLDLLSHSAPKHECRLAWTLLLQNHPHDSICGCSIDAVHRENENRFEQAGQICDALTRRQRYLLNTRLSVSPDEWLIINLGDHAYQGVIPATAWSGDMPEEHFDPGMHQWDAETVLLARYQYDDQDVPQSHKLMRRYTGYIWVANIPPKTVMRIPKSQMDAIFPEIQIKAIPEGYELSNDRLVIQAHRKMGVMIRDRQGKTYPNLFQLIGRPDQGDSYNAAPVPHTQEDIAILESLVMHAAGPLKGAIRLTYRFPKQELAVSIMLSLYAGSSQVEFETSFINTLPNYKIQAVFHSENQPVRKVFAEGHFGVTALTYDPDYRIEDAMPAKPGEELKTNTGPIQRFLAFNHQLLITEGLTEYEVAGATLRLTLLRAFGKLSSADTGVRGAPAGPPFETPEGQCLGRLITGHFAWLPWNTDKSESLWAAEAYEETLRFYGVVHAEAGRGIYRSPLEGEGRAGGRNAHNEGSIRNDAPLSAHECQSYTLLHWDNPHVVSSALYHSEQGWVARLVNVTGDSQTLRFRSDFPVSDIFLADFQEAVKQQIPPTWEIPPYAVETFIFQL